MRKLKKAVSILLSIVLIGSMFTILSVTSASAETVQVFARKWVKAENETGDYFSLTDLYQNFVICRCKSDMVDPSFNDVYNQTANMSLNSHNEIRLNSWDDGNGKLAYYWSDYSDQLGNGKIYLSTNGNGTNFNIDGVQWYAYTWETFTVDEFAATSPTYSNGVYTDGLSAHYETADRYFVKTEGSTDGNQNVEQVSQAQITIPYFEYEYLTDDETIRLKKCNSDDAEITVPDEIPSQYYPSDAPAGKTCTIIGEGAFAEKNNLTAVTIGDNVNHISGSTDAGVGAFSRCGKLQSVTIGSSFNYAGQYCFARCNSLTDFTTTPTEGFPNQAYFSGLQDLNKSGTTIHCYHATSGIASLCNEFDKVTFVYLDEPPATHTYRASYWDWDNFDTDHTVKALVSCSVCSKEFGEMDATIEEVVDTPPTTTAGSGHYKAVVTIDGQTLEDDDNHSHTFTIEPMGATLEGHSISLNGDIAVNFYVKLSSKVAASENAYMRFNVPETSTEYREQIVYVKDLTPVTADSENYYVFKCRVAAKDMEAQITATLIDGDLSYTFDPYCVRDYAQYLLTHTEIPAFENAQELVRAMLTYGMHARAYFDSTADALDALDVTIPDHYSEQVDADAEDIYDGMSISLRSQTTLSLFFKSEDGLTLTCDNFPVDHQYVTAKDGNNYVIRIRNIAAADLDKQINVEVNGNLAVAACPLTYCYKVQNSPDEKLANVANALYRYWEAASQYFMS